MRSPPPRPMPIVPHRARPLALALLSTLACSDGGSTVPMTTGTDSTDDGHDELYEPLEYACEDGEADALYEQRIAPLLATERPSSCNSCHLPGIDLEMFVQSTPCQTMACLVERDLVDLEDPGGSTILEWIDRGQPSSGLVSEQAIDEEYAGFRAWIEQEAQCGACDEFEDPCGDAQAEPQACAPEDPEATWADPGDCSEPTLEAMFRHRVYRWRDRCYPCHFDGKDSEGPDWIFSGECQLASLRSMNAVLREGLVDPARPEQSRLLLKPLAEGAGGLEHGGHDKFETTADQAYLDIKAWIQRRAQCAP